MIKKVDDVSLSLKFELLNVSEWLKDTGEVNSSKLKTKKQDLYDPEHPVNGLFSEVVFGPVKDYQCACGRYKGVISAGRVCERCGVKVQSSSSRRFTYGHIKVGKGLYLVSNEPFKQFLENCVTDRNLKNLAMNLVLGKVSVDISKDPPEYGNFFESNFTGPIAFKEILYPQLIQHMYDTVKNEKIINELFPMIDKCLFTDIIPVVPPDLRPITSTSGSACFIDELNKVYMVILIYMKFINNSPVIPHDKLASLQQQYFNLTDMILKKLSSKSGIMRKYILGKRVDYSGRGVIVPDPTLNLCEIDMSFYILKEIFQPAILPKLASIVGISELEALNTYESSKYDDIIFDICQQYVGYPLIINRQPTLHRPSMLSFFIRKILRNYTIAIPPTACVPLNADFDGDQIAVYAPIGGAAHNEAINMMSPSVNIYLPSNGEMTFKFEEDLVLGLYKLSLTEEGKNKIYSELDEDVIEILRPYADKYLTGKNLNEFFSELIDTIDEKRIADIINVLAHISMSESVISVSLVDYKTAEKGNSNNPVSLMVDAGARGNYTQVKQIQSSRGFVSDIEGRVIPSAINSSLLNGLNQNEWFASAYGSIKGLIDSSKNTSMSGYLTRRMIYITSAVELDQKLHDCGTDHYLSRTLTEDNYKIYLYRFFKNPENGEEFVLTKFNYKEKLNIPLLMRSPLTCKCEGNKICHKCYGLLYRKHKSRQIGYIAAQSLGERASQLTLRTKHISGVTNITLPSWAKIEGGYIITEIPTIITITPETVVISDNFENEEFEIPLATVDIIAPNAVKESSEEIEIDADDEEFVNIEVRYNIPDVGKIATISMKNHDVVTSVSEFSRYIRNLSDETKDDPELEHVLDHVLTYFGVSGIHSVHYEVVMSNFCRNADNTQLYYRHNLDKPYIWIKEKTVLDNSLVQSIAFERFGQKLSKMLLADSNDMNFKGSILSKMTDFKFENKNIIDTCEISWRPEEKGR